MINRSFTPAYQNTPRLPIDMYNIHFPARSSPHFDGIFQRLYNLEDLQRIFSDFFTESTERFNKKTHMPAKRGCQIK